MLKIVDSIERIIVRVLIILLLAGIVLGTIELARVLVLEVFAPPFLLLDISRLFEGFGLVLVILIGMELLKSMKMFLAEDKIKPELFVEVALIALCNKVITLDAKHTGGDVLLGVAALFVGLAAVYFVLRFHAARDNKVMNASVGE
jgi:uncharacterized membrane protein (DUF373 family)